MLWAKSAKSGKMGSGCITGGESAYETKSLGLTLIAEHPSTGPHCNQAEESLKQAWSLSDHSLRHRARHPGPVLAWEREANHIHPEEKGG